MENLKEMFKPARVRVIAEAIRRAHPSFEAEKFLAEITPQLKKHELKGRVQLIATALKSYLPAPIEKSFPILLRAILSEKNPEGLEGFQAWPFTKFVEDNGMGNPKLSLETLGALTNVMSAEFAIRPFLLEHTDFTLGVLKKWAKSENVHLRRLASEGSRPRLPWGQRLPHFQKDPTTCIGLLRELRLDPELYVRKSVANHLNDFSKDHPDWLVKELSHWQKEFPEDKGVAWIIRHSVRSLIKAGHPGALALLGFREAKVSGAQLKLSPRTVKLGGALEISFTASSPAKEAWLIDYAIHHRKNNGGLKAKVFKWTKKQMPKGGALAITKKHRFVRISTREYYSGVHELEILVNGTAVAKESFKLIAE